MIPVWLCIVLIIISATAGMLILAIISYVGYADREKVVQNLISAAIQAKAELEGWESDIPGRSIVLNNLSRTIEEAEEVLI